MFIEEYIFLPSHVQLEAIAGFGDGVKGVLMS